jgi:DNA polymerase-3 subunit delta'
MGFEDFFGNRGTVDLLRGMMERDRLPHALIVSGPAGVGKYTLVQMLSKALHCLERQPERKPDFCGQCVNCRAIALADDRRVAVEEAEQERETISRRPREIPLLVQHHQDVLMLPPNGPLRLFQIEQARHLKQALLYLPSGGCKKIFILPEADRMDSAAANSLLKSLEEPPLHVLLLLTTARESALLPTIRSRCVTLRMGPLPRGDVAAFLQRAGAGRDDQERAWRAAFSKGSPGLALRMDVEHYRNVRDALLRMLEAGLVEGSFAAVIAQAQKLSSAKEPLENLLDVLYSLLQDILHIEAKSNGEPLRNVDRPKPLWQVARRLGPAGMTRAVAALRRLEKNLRRNVPVESALEAFVAQEASVGRMS